MDNVSVTVLPMTHSAFICDDGCCIDITFACDGVKQCPDGSDETFCQNRKSSLLPAWNHSLDIIREKGPHRADAQKSIPFSFSTCRVLHQNIKILILDSINTVSPGRKTVTHSALSTTQQRTVGLTEKTDENLSAENTLKATVRNQLLLSLDADTSNQSLSQGPKKQNSGFVP
ncbi:hypothetical protein CIB84_012383, partial [Bambusicola thoracicus]